MADDNKNKGLESKQGNITPQDLSGTSPKRLKIPGFKGSYRGVVFNDSGVSDGPVTKEIADELRTQFPGLEVEEYVEPEADKKKK